MGIEVKVLAGFHIPGSAQLSLKPNSGLNQPNYLTLHSRETLGRICGGKQELPCSARFWFWWCCDHVVELLRWSSGLGRLSVFMTLAG